MASINDLTAFMAQLYAVSDKPSLDRSTAWHSAVGAKGFVSDDKSGKWCVFVPVEAVDAAWLRVKAAVLDGLLCCAKVSTAYARQERSAHVICVYTRDWNNKAELEGSRTVLRDLGFTEELGYKRDLETMNGVYGGADEWFIRI